ncbi:cyclic nucleotide-binding protein [Pseudoalteromonas porphyrae]|uniref:Crp/Fnr family transcriptional regulator n=1 Tax=Pseudoalteromonas TaxID=53246 RepID=UPI0006BAB733|nr:MULTISPECIES: Crp/Fnr family transcriptional regulator [Pseudoalteromonas]KPH93541.1 cyclic nucleotide-binding protein [Pseudoalteromonas porphyrae]NMR24868.1 Crp/Fnr family transcriptional regulator [Pseudoalteromonas sp. NEC-BIFX-2020_015]NNG43466.1 Crp/Fnr family transcriptional regulator [Pseudoalteromonas sp. NEC-BIFX-2020_002]
MPQSHILPLGDSNRELAHALADKLAGRYPTKQFERDDVLVQQGQKQYYGYLLLDGVLGALHATADGGQKCKEFYFKDEFALLFTNWLTDTDAFYQLKVIKSAKVIVVPLSLFTQPAWQCLKQQLITQQLIFKEAKEAFLLLNTPEQRYCYLVNEKPHWLAQLNLTEVALYIGISAISLSRIRKRLNLS